MPFSIKARVRARMRARARTRTPKKNIANLT